MYILIIIGGGDERGVLDAVVIADAAFAVVTAAAVCTT